ncbi:MAG: hypothetical protein CL522_00100 [Actinobacteria bacterium]|nr:hypothetical protein [Actinomycetota bacterium]|tara:strand:+ start:73 stop:1218 length:1146 start_codon:yes stop_codon:yes gene_type:complete
MNKNTTLITAITALFVAFLVLTTACLPAGNTDLSNLTEAKATYKSLILDNTETHEHSEEQEEVETNVTRDETHQEANDHGHSHNEYVSAPEMGQTQLVVEEAPSNEAHTSETQNAEAAEAEIKRFQQQLQAVLTDTSITYTWGAYDPDTALLQELLGTTVDGIYGNMTQRLHMSALEERGLNTDSVPTAPVVVQTPAVKESPAPVTVPASCSGITCFDGYEGKYQAQVEAAAAALPAELRTAFGGVTVVNGCHPYAKVTFGRCVYGVWDSAGWDANGNHGADWSYTLWVSNRGVESGRLTDIMAHEAGHAYSYAIARRCVNPETGNTFRVDAREIFGGEEPFADGITAYYNGASAFQSYRGTGTALSSSETDILEKMFSSC